MIASMKWILKSGFNFRHWLKTDDDSFVRVDRLSKNQKKNQKKFKNLSISSIFFFKFLIYSFKFKSFLLYSTVKTNKFIHKHNCVQIICIQTTSKLC